MIGCVIYRCTSCFAGPDLVEQTGGGLSVGIEVSLEIDTYTPMNERNNDFVRVWGCVMVWSAV